MPQNTATFTIQEHNPKEPSSFSVNIGPLTAANFTAKRAAISALEAAAQAVIIGVLSKTSISENFSNYPGTAPSTAQRGLKWLITYKDITQFLDVANTINNVGFGNTYTKEIPTANLGLVTNVDEYVDITDAPWDDFVAAFEAVENSPTGGNEVQILSIQLVNRSG